MNTNEFIKKNEQGITAKKVYRVSYADSRPDEIVTIPVEDVTYFEDMWENSDEVTYYREAEEDDLGDEQETVHYWQTKADSEKEIFKKLDAG